METKEDDVKNDQVICRPISSFQGPNDQAQEGTETESGFDASTSNVDKLVNAVELRQDDASSSVSTRANSPTCQLTRIETESNFDVTEATAEETTRIENVDLTALKDSESIRATDLKDITLSSNSDLDETHSGHSTESALDEPVALPTLKRMRPFKSPMQLTVPSRQSISSTELKEPTTTPKRLKTRTDLTSQEIEELNEEDYTRLRIKLLHEYNDVKDIGQMLLGIFAQKSGKTVREMYEKFDIGLED
jgi:hypothetical protein